MQLQKAILAECHKLISRHGAGTANSLKIRKRFERVAGIAAGTKSRSTPVQWSVAPDFNPFKVRRRAEVTAKAITTNLSGNAYSPRPALILPIPKQAGGVRQVSIFPVADAALASFFYRRIQRRNQSRLSPFSYAYRSDLSAQDALARMWRMFSERSRAYIVEFDFSKYFDTISHEYLLDVLRRHFQITRTELQVVRAFLTSDRAYGVHNYKAGSFIKGSRGVPQGNSLSLFLANAACHELDHALGARGLQFCRYADDIVVFCKEDHVAGEAFELITEHCERTGLAINFEKSEGITECTPKALAKTRPLTMKSYVDYLGHRAQFRTVARRNGPAKDLVRRLSIRPSTETRIREKLSNIIYSHPIALP